MKTLIKHTWSIHLEQKKKKKRGRKTKWKLDQEGKGDPTRGWNQVCRRELPNIIPGPQ